MTSKHPAVPMDLWNMLRTMRPMGSDVERWFRRNYLLNLTGAWEDLHGNIHVEIPRKDGKGSSVVWSCHTDTVHDVEGYQRIAYDPSGWIALAGDETSNCLGADCTAGVWIMRQMILSGIPGHYVFHWGEERGCIGSRALVGKDPDEVKGAKAVIAFDRHGFTEAITHQRGRRCASDACALSLKGMMGPHLSPSDRGVYTDSAEYSEIVAECLNIAVGYMGEHTEDESLYVPYIVQLWENIRDFWDEDKLVIERKPEPRWAKYVSHYPNYKQHGFWKDRKKDRPEEIISWGSPTGPKSVIMGPHKVEDKRDPNAMGDSYQGPINKSEEQDIREWIETLHAQHGQPSQRRITNAMVNKLATWNPFVHH